MNASELTTVSRSMRQRERETGRKRANYSAGDSCASIYFLSIETVTPPQLATKYDFFV